MRRPVRKFLGSMCLLVWLAGPAAAEAPPSDQLNHQAGRYLDLLDLDRYEEAWQKMSPLFQALSNHEQWLKRHKTIRSTYGVLTSRQFYRIDYRQSYSLSPDGQYVIIQYKSSYQNKAETNETVVFDCSTTPDCSIREYVIR